MSRKMRILLTTIVAFGVSALSSAESVDKIVGDDVKERGAMLLDFWSGRDLADIEIMHKTWTSPIIEVPAPSYQEPINFENLSEVVLRSKQQSVYQPAIASLARALGSFKKRADNKPFQTCWEFDIIGRGQKSLLKVYADESCRNGVYDGVPVVFDDKLARWIVKNLKTAFQLEANGYVDPVLRVVEGDAKTEKGPADIEE